MHGCVAPLPAISPGPELTIEAVGRLGQGCSALGSPGRHGEASRRGSVRLTRKTQGVGEAVLSSTAPSRPIHLRESPYIRRGFRSTCWIEKEVQTHLRDPDSSLEACTMKAYPSVLVTLALLAIRAVSNELEIVNANISHGRLRS